MKNIYDVIKAPVITEKATILKEDNKVVLKVAKDATKKEIKDAVEKLFKVKVEAVRTIILPGKWKRVGRSMGRTNSWKKAVVTLKQGEKLDFIES
ncbi:MAG: 50S ribosomal protein L23 [Proteobacteria bacterium]|nr:50S ribosomal protein L23 [Pseudomonadota bacterium]